MFENGVAGGGGHGGKGGDGYYNGNFIKGGVTYGDAGLPCELGSGSGNDSIAGATAGGGIIGKLSTSFEFFICTCLHKTDAVSSHLFNLPHLSF